MASTHPSRRDEVFSLREIARAAGVPVRQARAWAEAEHVPIHKSFVKLSDAVALVRSLKAPQSSSLK